MSYCLNPSCKKPKNPDNLEVCAACGSPLKMRDRYLGVKSLGRGGFGTTFLAQDMQLPGNPLCVIKQLRPSTNDPQIFQMAKELFEREAETLGKIGNHPQVPRLLDYFEYNKDFYLVQEYVKGHNLQQEVKQNGPLSEAGVRQFLQEILPMLDYIHTQQVIHRDIKPANLIRREQDKKLVLIDFGAVKNKVNPQAAANTSDQTALTSFAIGTPGFAPPEQMALRPVYASDVYALGVTCIYLMTAKSPKDLQYNQKTGEMMWRQEVDISENFAKVLYKMLDVSVRHRYQSARDVLNALDMEPYMDSLAQSMIAPTGGNAEPEPEPEEPPDSQPSSATQRLAMAIRAKRDRNKGHKAGRLGGSLNRMSNRLPNSGRGMQTSGRPVPGKKKVSRLDAKTVLDSYRKGRRDFAQQVLSTLNLQEAQLAGGIFHQSKLRRTNLQGANLEGADFGRASLAEAVLRDANLGRAYLSGADLEGADLRGADLSHANLTRANLKNANLCGANLKGAKVKEEQLSLAKTNWFTVLPQGRKGLW
ncbi:serine/threonine-protein kinase [Spirulina sp. CS-785/01]|uniref:serine/threonine-protein kinase n=1 Tax=Spirulina sp. CS-785/01 TaxID=3021716 RepID=UPI00232DD41B|nr:serine/threonine-protein kinase [Spirulina sp. CS-785/01]MDB9313515.1 serine/threonine-protein kinase [Spirulina sp. CS-785/01]